MSKSKKIDEVIDLRHFVFRLLGNWYYFLLSILLSLTIAFAINRYSKEVYFAETSLLVKKKPMVATNAADMLLENTYQQERYGLKNEELFLTSSPLIYQTVSDLDFGVCYYAVGKVKTTEIYEELPFRVVHTEDISQLHGEQFSIKVLNQNEFQLFDSKTITSGNYRFGQEIEIGDFTIKLKAEPDNITDNLPVIMVRIFGINSVVKQYQEKIKITQPEKESTILNIGVYDQSLQKGVAFLNKLTENYIGREIAEKNLISSNTIDFIDEKLIEMKDSLTFLALGIQNFKHSHEITDINLKAENFYKKIAELEQERSIYILKQQYFNYLLEAINKENQLNKIISPSVYGINDASLNELINQFVSFQIQKEVIKEEGQINNPAIARFETNINQLVEKIKESVESSVIANNTLIKDVNSRLKDAESLLSSLPSEERELLTMQRLHDISEKMYMFLLQKRAEAGITESANVADSRVIEPAIQTNSKLVSPDNVKNYLLALFIGLLLPILTLFLLDAFRDTIISRSDIERITKIPLLGIIGRNYSEITLVHKQNPKSIVAEGFRALRSNIGYIEPKTDRQVLLITSSVSGEGKSFIAANLAITFANTGKKTLLIGADLRKPKIAADFALDTSVGLSSYLKGEQTLGNLLLETELPNLHVIVAGPIPANPAELLTKSELATLFQELKKQFDIIILDSPPVGLVSDALLLSEHADEVLFVARQNFTKKGLLLYIDELYKKQRIRNIQLVLNDVKAGSGVYGYSNYSYGYGYGYGYGYNYSKKNTDLEYFEE